MPDLPTVSVTAAQADKLMEVFGSVQDYRDWLIEAVKDEARRRNLRALQENANLEISYAVGAFEDELPQ